MRSFAVWSMTQARMRKFLGTHAIQSRRSRSRGFWIDTLASEPLTGRHAPAPTGHAALHLFMVWWPPRRDWRRQAGYKASRA